MGKMQREKGKLVVEDLTVEEALELLPGPPPTPEERAAFNRALLEYLEEEGRA